MSSTTTNNNNNNNNNNKVSTDDPSNSEQKGHESETKGQVFDPEFGANLWTDFDREFTVSPLRDWSETGLAPVNSEEFRRGLVEEMITSPDNERLCLMPIQFQKLFDNWEEQMSKFWSPREIDHSKDFLDWKKMNKDEQRYIIKNLAFFANSDNAVIQNIATRFRQQITVPEAQMAMSAQEFFETIHVLSYNNMIQTVVKDKKQREALFRSVHTDPIIAKKIQWIQKWAADPNTPIHVCTFTQTCSEGIGFSPGFASIFWVRKNQMLPGIGFGNEKILVDEALHVKLFAELYKMCTNKLTRPYVEAIVSEIVAIEHEFVDHCLPYKLKGMNKNLMKQYVCKVADTVLEQLGEAPMYRVANPFPWMENINMRGKTNQFEKVTGEYELAGLETEINEETFEHLGKSIDF